MAVIPATQEAEVAGSQIWGQSAWAPLSQKKKKERVCSSLVEYPWVQFPVLREKNVKAIFSLRRLQKLALGHCFVLYRVPLKPINDHMLARSQKL